MQDNAHRTFERRFQILMVLLGAAATLGSITVLILQWRPGQVWPLRIPEVISRGPGFLPFYATFASITSLRIDLYPLARKTAVRLSLLWAMLSVALSLTAVLGYLIVFGAEMERNTEAKLMVSFWASVWLTCGLYPIIVFLFGRRAYCR